jgi:chromosomal replication initiation ATPase DnaA
MDVTQIMDAVRDLPMGAKKVLAYKVIGEIDRIEKLEGAITRYQTILSVAEAVSGLRHDPAKRDSQSVLLRTITAWRMMEEGYPTTEIGRAMGKDHSTVSYYARQRKDALALPMAYREHLTMYGKLALALNDGND